MGYSVQYRVIDEGALTPLLSRRGDELAKRRRRGALDCFEDDETRTVREMLSRSSIPFYDLDDVLHAVADPHRRSAGTSGGMEDHLDHPGGRCGGPPNRTSP